MATTVIGVFDDAKTVRKVINELVEAGCRKEDIDTLGGNEDEVIGEIVDRGFAKEQARTYAEAVRSGKKLVAARTPDEAADGALAIMGRHESDDEDSERDGERRNAGPGETLREVEEELSVGKRKVVRGGVRVSSTVTETPVEKTVRLREEEVEVDRESVDRMLSPEEAVEAFKERTIEMTETGEEAKVEKKARVTGEVSLRKESEGREETVRDTVRRTEVEVEKLQSGSRKKK
jgi:stress response protein YsnF